MRDGHCITGDLVLRHVSEICDADRLDRIQSEAQVAGKIAVDERAAWRVQDRLSRPNKMVRVVARKAGYTGKTHEFGWDLAVWRISSQPQVPGIFCGGNGQMMLMFGNFFVLSSSDSSDKRL